MDDSEEEVEYFDAQEVLHAELENLLWRFTEEWDISYCEMIGALQMASYSVFCESLGEEGDDYDDEEEGEDWE